MKRTLSRLSHPLMPLIAASLVLAGCTGSWPMLVLPAYTPAPASGAAATAAPAETPTPAPTATPAGPPALDYDLGEAAIPQPGNARGDMPVRLQGVIAVPEGPGPHPVVVILHGAGFGCPPQDESETTWPCGDQEQRNDTGFRYLAAALAGRGYIALVPDVNAQYELAYGEPREFDRLSALFDQHLARLAAANRGEESRFGVDLTGKVDLGQIAVAGHSRSGQGAFYLADSRLKNTSPEETAAGRGPISALLLIAPDGCTAVPPEGQALSPDVPFSVVLPQCDGQDLGLAGQCFYEAARLDEKRKSLAASVYLYGANHNAFNAFLEADDAEGLSGKRAGCDAESRLAPEAQRDFLARYAADFFDTALRMPQASATAAAAGLEAGAPAPDRLYGHRALTSLSVPTADRRRLLAPASKAELKANLLGGAAQAILPAEVTYCPGAPVAKTTCAKGFYPPGNEEIPSLLRLSWTGANGLYQTDLPKKAGDLSPFAALSLRVAVDPASSLNPAGEAQTFSVVLRDATGGAAVVTVPATEPALAYPPGELETEEGISHWSGFTPLSTVRIPLSAFDGVDLKQVIGLALAFDGSESGSLLLTDLEFVAAARK